MKKLVKILGVLIVIGIVGLVVLYFSLGGIVRKAVEVGASDALDTRVQVESTRISPFAGEVEITKLEVANPKGFQQPEAFSFGRLLVSASIPSLLRDVIKVPQIEMEGLHLTVEQAGLRTNIGALLDNLEGEPGEAGEEKPGEEGPPKEGGAPGKKFQIDLFRVVGTKVTLASSLMKGNATEIEIPGIEIQHIGTGEDGPATLAKVLAVVLRRVLKETSIGQGEIPESVRKLLAGEAQIGEAVGKVKQAVEETLGKKAGEEAKKAVDALKGLFGGEK